MTFREREEFKSEIRKEIALFQKFKNVIDMYELFRSKLILCIDDFNDGKFVLLRSYVRAKVGCYLDCFSMNGVLDDIQNEIMFSYENSDKELYERLKSLKTLVEERIEKEKTKEATKIVKTVFSNCAEHAEEIVKIIGTDGFFIKD